MTLAEIHNAIRERYKGDGYALAFEVRNQSGYASSVNRYADALCLGLWKTNGHYLQGFEFKVSRSDVIKELTSPEKAREIQRYCHYWWLVVGDAKIVSVDELPASWGLMVPCGSGLVVKKAAPLQTPEPPSYPFVGSLIRSCVRSAVREDAVAERIAAAVREAVAQEEHRRQRLESRLQEVEKALGDFRDASGVDISRWTAGNVGAAVRAVVSGGLSRSVPHLESMESQLERLLSNLRDVKRVAAEFSLEVAS